MLSKKTALMFAFLAALIVQGCGTGATDSGPTAAGSGAPGPESGAAGSKTDSPTRER